MATIEQAPPTPGMGEPPAQASSSEGSSSANILNSLLARAYTLNWEMIFYVGLFIITVLTRFVNLGDRVMSHDESLHVKYSHDLYKDGNFAHTPLMHGPLLFHMTALMYFLFGASDFTGRLYPAILGTIMVFFPKLLFQRWLGKFGAMVGSILLLISPMVLFHNRYIREDTPSIFFTLLMVYAIFAYIDGVRPLKLRWLVLLSAAMLLSLASKEVGFMYIGIFGIALTLFWILQVVQGIRSGRTSPTVGWILGSVVGVAGLGVVSLVAGNAIGTKLNDVGVGISPRIVEIIVAVLCAFGLLLLFQPVKGFLGWIGERANSTFRLLMAGVLLGAAASLGATVVFNIIPLSSSVGNPDLAYGQFSWLLLIGVPLVLVVIGTAFARFTGSNWLGLVVTIVFGGLSLLFVIQVPLLSRVLLALALVGALWLLAGMSRIDSVPWADILLAGAVLAVLIGIGLLAFIVDLSLGVKLGIATALVVALVGVAFLVNRSGAVRLPWGDIALMILVALASAFVLVYIEEKSKQTTTKPDGIHNEWIIGAWVLCLLASAGLIALRFMTNFFQEMRRYPVFDVLILIATLIFPWVAAYPIFQAGYALDGNYLDATVIGASFAGVAPFVILMIVAGLCWRPRDWLICAATFYSLFAFFYTTIFTNINGLATGLVGSLGYWLAQQGVRRGSQPQYYYLLVEMPIYEYLPIIGAVFASVVGMLGFWRLRREQLQELDALYTPSSATSDVTGESEVTITDVQSNETQIASVHQTAVYPVTGADSELVTPIAASPAAPVETLPPLEGDAPTTGVNNDPAVVDPLADMPERKLHPLAALEVLDRLPFLPFVGFWALMIIFAFTLAGEKMPWLTTHLTIPLGFLTAWYIGTQLEKIEWSDFWKQSWWLIGLTPVLVVALANVVAPFVLGNGPFGGLERDQLLKTFTWMGAVLLAGLIIYGVWYVWRRVGTQLAARTVVIGLFFLLMILTARIAWMAAFINYDSAREFMVYAHGAPADKTIMQTIEEISRRTTDGKNVKVAYDNQISWPGTWYFRDYPNARYLGETPQSAGDLDSNLAIVIGDNHAAAVDPVLGDKYYKQKLIRMWWPMQDYFDLNKGRVDNIFSGDTNLPDGWFPGSKIRQGIWDIWWNRDYTNYGKAVNKTFDESQWPVADWMDFYVRKDVAAQIWDFGTGAVKVQGLPEDAFSKLRCDACTANFTFGSRGAEAGQMNYPRKIAVGPDGNVYVMDSQNTRVEVFNKDGNFLRQFGKSGSVDQPDPNNPTALNGAFREPWGIAVDKNGMIYVADTWNHRVEVFQSDGTFVRTWGKFEQVTADSAFQPDTMWGPRDITVDINSNVYVADTGNKRIRVYDSLGNFKQDIGKDMLNEPVGLVINDGTHELFVADTWNKRIQVFGLDGTPLRSWNVQAWGTTTTSGNRPYLALDRTGTILFVSDPDANRVLVFNTQGKALVSFGTADGNPAGIATDSDGNVFIVQSNTGVMLRYSQANLPELIPPTPIQPMGNQGNQGQSGQGQQGQNQAQTPDLNGTPAATQSGF